MNTCKKKILIVDDAEINREILFEMLKDEYDILQAKNGKEAIEILTNYHEELRLVLLDMNMPEMNGNEVLKIMKDRLWLERIPTICISSDSTDETILKTYEMGVTDYFTRPFEMEVVKRKIYNTIALYDKNKGNLEDIIGMLSVFFYRILKINLTTRSYRVLKDGEEDITARFNEISDIYERLASFAWKGYVHEDDKEEYLKFCNENWLKKQFTSGKDHLMFHYRRNITGQFRWVSMELFRSSEYTDTNQMIILYVRDINDEYLKQLDVIMRRATDALGMVSLNITKGICIAGSVRKHYLQLQEGMERIEDYILRISENLVEKDERETIVQYINRDYLIKCFAEGKTMLTKEVVAYDKEKGELDMLRATIEMIKNSVSGELEGILYFTDITGNFLAEQMTSRLYQKNFDEVFVVDTKKKTMVVDTPDRFSSGNYCDDRLQYNDYILNDLSIKTPQKEKRVLFESMNLPYILNRLEEEERYSFTIHQLDEKGEKRLKNYTFVYLSKPFGVLLGASEDVTEISRKDVLTGGYNRQGFVYCAKKYLKAEHDSTQYAVLFLDIRNFKATNELFGREMGDSILREVYKSLRESQLRPLITARIEADHFICLVRKSDLDFEEIMQLCKLKIVEKQKNLLLFLSVGIYYLDGNEKSIGEMIDCAKIAKKYIKDEYVQPWNIYDASMKSSYIDKAKLSGEIEHGIENEEFVVYYQPVVDTFTEEIVSAEALVRWKHEEKGFISPGIFIPVLEENGYITELDSYVAKKVCDFLVKRKMSGKKNIPVSINLSWMDFYDEKIIEWLIAELKKLRTMDICTRIEITETSYAAISQDRTPILHDMKESGAQLLMDDFGSGYSSFGMLQNYNFDILKIDMSFVRQIETNEKTRGILQTIIDMGHRLEMKLIAEGVETKEQAEFLKNSGCDYIQGYYYYRPMPEEEFQKLLD